MKSNDVELIQRTLAGDETAFASLIEKYQRQVHTHALRQIGDFHIARILHRDLPVYQNCPERSYTVFKVASCDCESPLYRMAPKKSATDPIVGRNSHLGNRKRGIFPICRI